MRLLSRVSWVWAAGFLFAASVLPSSASADSSRLEVLTRTEWLFDLDGEWTGPVQAVVRFEIDGESIRGWTRSGSLEVIRSFVKDGSRSESPSFASMRVNLVGGSMEGEFALRGKEYPFAATFEDDGTIRGTIEGGLVGGTFAARPFEGTLPLRDYDSLFARLGELVASRVYNPAELQSAGWNRFRSLALKIAETANDDLDFVLGLRWAFENDPFSHFEVKRSATPVAALMEYFDQMRVGGDPVRLSFRDDIAILEVDTMMGLDTIELIDAAYGEISARKPRALVVDLRNNGGGAFAVRPLVSHVLEKPINAGYFVGNPWWSQHGELPSSDQLEKLTPWQGWSILSFWTDVQSEDLLLIRFEPQEPVFRGPVYVLAGESSASATELALAAFRTSGRVTIVGNKTAGEMLSGSFFDLGEEFSVFLPVADYYSITEGRIEGAGVEPDIEVSSADALEKVLDLLND